MNPITLHGLAEEIRLAHDRYQKEEERQAKKSPLLQRAKERTHERRDIVPGAARRVDD